MAKCSPQRCAPVESPSRYTGTKSRVRATKAGFWNKPARSRWQGGHHSAPQYSRTRRPDSAASAKAASTSSSRQSICAMAAGVSTDCVVEEDVLLVLVLVLVV